VFKNILAIFFFFGWGVRCIKRGHSRFCEMGLGSCNYSLYYLYGPDGGRVRSYKLDMNVM